MSPSCKIFPLQIVHRRVRKHYILEQKSSRSRSDTPIRHLGKRLPQILCRIRRVSGLEVNLQQGLWEIQPEAQAAEDVEESIQSQDLSISRVGALAQLSGKLISPYVKVPSAIGGPTNPHSPTFTAVLPSSSDALLPSPCLLPKLMRLELRCI